MTEKKTDAYERVDVQGHTLNKRTYAAFLTAQARPKSDNDWTIFQGSYNTSVDQSAGTHAGGGAIDISAFNWQQRVHALRAVGFCAWHRPYNWDGRNGGEHIHAILRGDREMSSAASSQVTQYDNHTDGLADAAHDDFPYHPNHVTFDYPAYVRAHKRVKARAQRAVKAVKAAVKALVRARKNTDDKKRKAEIQSVVKRLRNSH